MKRYTLLMFLTTLQIFPGNGFMLEGCVRSLTITNLMHQQEMNSVEFQINSKLVRALDWKSCFMSCCSLSFCRQVVYSKQRCSHVQCTGSHGFCKYRPDRLKDNSLHGIIITYERHDQTLSKQLDRLQFRNGPSLVTSDMRFTHAQQCAQYVEPENVTGVATSWATERFSSAHYLYQDNGQVPPLGMRSAVPLGGLGTGSFELRADGTFNEWTLENQSPGGSAKLGRSALDLAFLAVRVQTQHGSKASLLRTHPPHGFPGVDGISYSGGYPVSKLEIQDKGFFGINMELLAYGSMKARSATDSVLPSVVFSLRVRNPTSYRTDVSLLLNLPLGEQPDTSRRGNDFETIHGITSSIVCATYCRNSPKCMAWSLEDSSCQLKDKMSLHAYKQGVTSGVKNWWESRFGRLTCNRPGHFPNSGNTTIMWVANDYGSLDNADKYGSYDNTKRNKRDSYVTQEQNEDYLQYSNQYNTVMDNNNYNSYYYYNKGITNTKTVTKKLTLKQKTVKYHNQRNSKRSKTNKHKDMTFSSAVSDDINQIWDYFVKYGNLENTVVKETGFHGSGVGRISLGPGEEGTISLVMSWYYPYRDHAGEYVGQYYRNIFKSSEDVAFHTKQDLPKILDELLSWRENMTPSNHSTEEVFHVDSSIPDWLQDMLVNSFSFWRTAFWVADGRWRQWETFDCNDVDSVHNDFQRELPYILFFPGLLENVVRGWAKSQHESGLIPEALQRQYGCWSKTNKLDDFGGRYNMADVIPAFIAQVYHLYIWAGKENLLQDLWPAVRKAAVWMIQEGTNGTALPLHMTNTYDILQLQKYDHSFYNSVIFLLGLRVTEEMAEVQMDADMYLLTREAIVKAKEKINELFWDEERGYYHAWWDRNKGSPPWLMADSLYGQVWAYTLGLGDLLDSKKMKSHLEKEAVLNDTPYGLQVMTTNDHKSTAKRVRKRETSQDSDKEFNEYFTNLENNILMGEMKNYAGLSNTWNSLRYQKQPYDDWWKRSNYGAVSRAQEAEGWRGWDSKEVSDQKTPHVESYLRRHANKNLLYDNNYDNGWNEIPGNSDTYSYANQIPLLDNRRVKITKWMVANSLSNNKDYNTKTKAEPVSKKTHKVVQQKPSSNCRSLHKVAMYKSIWMGASPDWTTLQIHLGLDPSKALHQARKSLNHYRNYLNDIWNIHGLTAGSGYGLDGQPWCTSHYTFHMVLWHIPLALSGQQYSIIERRLAFYPKLRVPYSLPFFVPYASGTIEAIVKYGIVTFKLTVTHGYLVLKELSISGITWPGRALKLEKGEYIIWP